MTLCSQPKSSPFWINLVGTWLARECNTVFGGLLFSQFGKHVLATGDLDEFRDPADAADEWIVPFLEIHLRLWPPTN